MDSSRSEDREKKQTGDVAGSPLDTLMNSGNGLDEVGIGCAITGAARQEILNRGKIEESSEAIDKWIKTLVTPEERIVIYREPEHLIAKSGLFGTMAQSEWIGNMKAIWAVLGEKYGFKSKRLREMVFNPKLPDGEEYTDAHARIEAENVARDAVILMGIRKDYASIGSMLEVGFLAARSALLSRKMVSFVQSAEEELGKDVVRARGLLEADTAYIAQKVPRVFAHYPDMFDASTTTFDEMRAFIEFLESGTFQHVNAMFLPRNDIENRVVISGSSSNPHVPDRLELMASLAGEGIKMYDTLLTGDLWTMSHYENQELPEKDRSLVNTVLISNASSWGAIKDVGIAIFRAIANGTYALIQFPEEPPMAGSTEPNADQIKTYNRSRKLAVAHYNRLVADFPWIQHYVKFTQSTEDLSRAAMAICKAQSDR